ncbi:HlyD family efflux transporter periplasmic adaptor subunit [Micromonospora sp. 4G57]|uniref:HlyD family efflux transporter periplasmic adaptor subunit n=1 Tax=Micromonospora sicca TaxID=2202420 RepID=A0ABU5J7L6_9ACTN|nr:MULTISPECIES: HlyD family efflux transporter periplasmic adaptor subunit [unclassified Micromonospora]MDZ5444623.1 HlyD family efflux transporter periplasmic adaptor subunit [Micromonospora sp. 4G57]MDZ5488576.1 HlyD family efflux transporter periplasmic adaptor subunit [Micromonospora sp. 4G53]
MGQVARTHPPRPPIVTRPRLLTALLAVVALTGTTAASCGDEKSPVALAQVGRSAVAEVIDAPATVTARAAATLTAPADGTLASLRFQPGQRVRRGQVLAVISSPSAQDRLRQAREALRAAKRAGRGVGVGDLGGSRRGTDQAAVEAFDTARAAAGKIGDPQLRSALLLQVESAQRQYESAARAADRAVTAVQRGVAGLNSAVGALSSAQRLQAQQAYDLAKATVDALTLRAPVDGVVQPGGTRSASGSAELAGLLGAGGATGLDPSAFAPAQGGPPAGVDDAVPAGGRVTAGTPVLTVVDTGALGLLAEVDETDVLLVRAGLAASVELDAVTGATYDARVRSVDVLPSTSARGGVTYRVRLALGAGRLGEGEAAPAPRPGMNAVVHLRVREAADAVAVPASAVFSADGRDAVWVLRDGKADQVPVTLGVQGQDLVQIVSGVQAGDQVVVRGADQVRDGQELR